MDYTSPKAIAAKSVVDSGRFELADLLDKLDVIWLQGDMTKDERDALTAEARERADPERSLPALAERVEALEAWRRSVESRLAALEAGGEQGGGTEGGGETDPEPSEEWPDYVQPTGAHDAYHVGDKITWGGKRWTCKMDGCVWDPGAYPQGWEYAGDAPEEPGDAGEDEQEPGEPGAGGEE